MVRKYRCRERGRGAGVPWIACRHGAHRQVGVAGGVEQLPPDVFITRLLIRTPAPPGLLQRRKGGLARLFPGCLAADAICDGDERALTPFRWDDKPAVLVRLPARASAGGGGDVPAA